MHPVHSQRGVVCPHQALEEREAPTATVERAVTIANGVQLPRKIAAAAAVGAARKSPERHDRGAKGRPAAALQQQGVQVRVPAGSQKLSEGVSGTKVHQLRYENQLPGLNTRAQQQHNVGVHNLP